MGISGIVISLFIWFCLTFLGKPDSDTFPGSALPNLLPSSTHDAHSKVSSTVNYNFDKCITSRPQLSILILLLSSLTGTPTAVLSELQTLATLIGRTFGNEGTIFIIRFLGQNLTSDLSIELRELLFSLIRILCESIHETTSRHLDIHVLHEYLDNALNLSLNQLGISSSDVRVLMNFRAHRALETLVNQPTFVYNHSIHQVDQVVEGFRFIAVSLQHVIEGTDFRVLAETMHQLEPNQSVCAVEK